MRKKEKKNEFENDYGIETDKDIFYAYSIDETVMSSSTWVPVKQIQICLLYMEMVFRTKQLQYLVNDLNSFFNTLVWTIDITYFQL